MKTRTTKHSLFMSAIALLLCCSMLIGTTFAWFTDSVTSAGNIIKSGTLDVTMHWADGKTDPTNTTWNDASQSTIFNYEKWEPGYTDVKHIKIANNGTLALKYMVTITAYDEDGNPISPLNVEKLAEAIDVYYLDPAQQIADRTAFDNIPEINKLGTLKDVLGNFSTTAQGTLESKTEDVITLALKMQENAGNEYQDKQIGERFAVTVFATQLNSEIDSFDKDYDIDSQYPASSSIYLAAGKSGVVTKNDVTIAIPTVTTATEGDYAIMVSNPNKEVVNGATEYSVDITLEHNGAKAPVADYTVNIDLGKNLSVSKLTHNGVDVAFTYNHTTGILSFTTDSFSPFVVTYTVKAAEDEVFPVTTVEELNNSITAGTEFKIASDIEVTAPVVIPEGKTIALDLGGNSLTGETTAIENNGTMTIKNGTLETTPVNCKSNTILNNGTLTLEGVEIIGAPMDSTGYPAYSVYNTGKLTIEDKTTISANRGAISMADGSELVINGGEFVVSDAADGRNMTLHVIYAYGYNSKLTINGGYFEMDHTSTGGASVICPAGATINVYGGDFRDAMDDNDWKSTGNFQNYMGYGAPVNVYGGTFDDMTFKAHLADLYTYKTNDDGTYTVILDETKATPSGSASEVGSAISSGKTAVLTQDITYNTAINNDAEIVLNGNAFEATGTINLGNNANLNMSNGDYVVNSTYGHIDARPTTAEGSTLTYENVNFSFNKLGPTYGPSTNRLGTVLEVCPAVSDAYVKVVFKNCTFNNAQVLFEGMSGKTGKFDATFENCTFNALTSSAPIKVQNYITGTLTIKNCTFNLDCTSSTASAISISSSNSTSVTLVADGNTINATAATPYTFDASKGETESNNVKVNGTPANIKFASFYSNTTATVTNTTATGIAAK